MKGSSSTIGRNVLYLRKMRKGLGNDMKLMHLSDLHLGKRVYGFSMIEDQRYILGQILELAKQEKPDGVLLAGDIYDKAVPAAEAVQLLDFFLTALAELGTAVFLISGNHDSPERMSFLAQLLHSRKIYIAQVYEGKTKPVILKDRWGEAGIYLLPFLRPSTVRHALPEQAEGIQNCQDALQKAIEQMEIPKDRRNVLLAHQFVTGAGRCESEEVFVGGIDQVDAAVFDAFDYVALGHIHSPQHIGRPEVRYCGTPLKYSFSECGQEKSVTMVELREKGTVEIRLVPLVPLRDMRAVRGSYLEVTARSFYEGSHTEDYLEVTLTDEEDVPDGMQKLRVIYPNLMRLAYDNRRTKEDRDLDVVLEPEKKTEPELFEEFFERQNNRPMSDSQRSHVQKLVEELKAGG